MASGLESKVYEPSQNHKKEGYVKFTCAVQGLELLVLAGREDSGLNRPKYS